jgi:hypothetical protein
MTRVAKVAIAGALAALILAAVLYVVHPLPPPSPTEAEIMDLQAQRDALQERLDKAVVASGEKALAHASSAGLMIGVPTELLRALAEGFVTGLFTDMNLTLHDLKVRHSGVVEAKIFLRKKTLGTFDLEVTVHEVVGVLRPGRPDVRFSAGRLAVSLPVSLAEGHGRAQVRLRWDSQSRAARVVCGDADVTKEVTGTVIPADYRLDGSFEVVPRGEDIILEPRFPDLAVRVFVDPTEQAWNAVDEAVRERSAACEMALEQVDVREKLREVFAKGFAIKIPGTLLRPIRLPAGIRRSLDVKGSRVMLRVKPTALVVAEERLWYGADVSLEARGRAP